MSQEKFRRGIPDARLTAIRKLPIVLELTSGFAVIHGFTDADELLLGALLFACACTCGTKSSAVAAISSEPHNLVTLFSDST